MTEKEKQKRTILNYRDFVRNHQQYSKHPSSNLDRYRYHLLHEFSLEPKEKSLDAVHNLIDGRYGDMTEFIFYRTVDNWGLPYIFVYGRPNENQITIKNGKTTIDFSR